MRQPAFFMFVVLCAFLTACGLRADDNLKFSGDFRYRYEVNHDQDKDTRSRHRMRLRINLDAKVNQQIDFRLQLVTGSDNPVTINQTFDEGFSTKEIRIQEAYFAWRMPYIKNLLLQGGKINVPYYAPTAEELIWDNDLRPEGFAIKYSYEYQSMSVSVNSGVFVVEERAADKDAWLFGNQLMLNMNLDQAGTYFLAGTGFYDYYNTKGYPTFYTENNGIGNSLDTNGNYREDFNILDLIAELGGTLLKTPVSVFGNYALNTAAAEDNTGWLIGARVGKAKDPGSWDFRYMYRKLEKDLTIGRFTDSALLGGGTNGKGHEINLNYVLLKNTMLSATFFFNKKNLDNPKNFYRHHLEITFGFK